MLYFIVCNIFLLNFEVGLDYRDVFDLAVMVSSFILVWYCEIIFCVDCVFSCWLWIWSVVCSVDNNFMDVFVKYSVMC